MRKKVRQKELFVIGAIFTKNQPFVSALSYLTIPYSQLDGGGSNINGESWDNDYAPYRKILRHMDSYVAYVEIGHLAVCASGRVSYSKTSLHPCHKKIIHL
jgi:hypothetical protein